MGDTTKLVASGPDSQRLRVLILLSVEAICMSQILEFRSGGRSMKASGVFESELGDDFVKVLWEDTERAFCKLGREDAGGSKHAFIPALSHAEHPTLESINRLAHEYELREYLDAEWALRPL